MAARRSLSMATYLALALRRKRIAALLQIAARLRVGRPDMHFLLTAMPGLECPEHLGEQEYFQVLDEDTLPTADAFLDHWLPDLCLWTGGYFKPALLNQAAKRELPVFLIDADEEGLNASRQRWLPELARANLRGFSSILARDGTAAQIMRRLGVPGDEISITGPLQEGGTALNCNEQERDEMAQVLAGRPVWLAAMVQPEELGVVIGAYREISRQALRLLLILVPDDETDGPEFLERLQEEHLQVAVWSEGDMPDESTQVLLADTWGEMGLWYRLAPVTFMASSLLPGLGGRDPYEPAALGSAVLYGPNVGRYLGAYSRLAGAGAARIVKDSESLAQALQQCLSPDQAAIMAAAGWNVVSEGAEVTDRVIDLVHDTLDALGVG